MEIRIAIVAVILVIGAFVLAYSTEYTSTRTNATFIAIDYDKTCINGVVYIVRNSGAYKGGITPYLQPNGLITSCEE